jgi:hypothetical protein
MKFRFKKLNFLRKIRKSSGRKIKIIISGGLAWSLMFGVPKLLSSRSSNLNYNSRINNEIVVLNNEFNSLNKNDLRVILVKAEDSNPITPQNLGTSSSNFPSGTTGGRHIPHVNPYRRAPKVVDTGLGGNPAGGEGGIPEFDDTSPALQKLDKINSEHPSFYSDKKKSADQCELEEKINPVVEIIYRIKESPSLIREAEISGRDQAAQKSMNHLIDQLSLGNPNPEIGTQHLFKGVYELRGKNRVRVYYQKIDGKIEILGKSVKHNQKKVIDI